MKTRSVVPFGALCAALAGPLPVAGQQVQVQTAALFESYTFDAGLPFTKVSEFTVPVTITYQLGRYGNIALSSGFASVDLNSSDTGKLPHQNLSGVLDTEARLSVNVVPGRLVALFTGAIPTGVETVAFEELSVLGAISSDVIGFSTNDFGTGGNVGGGFAGALPLGRLAVGFGGTFKQPLSYSPVAEQSRDLRPGSEFRLRAGIQGPLGRRTYLRAAAIFAQRQKDEIDGVVQNGVGNRFTGYLSVDRGFGSKQLTLYAFDVFRADPRIEQTATGAAFLPRGNLLGVGGQLSIPVGFTASVAPKFEFRHSVAAPDTSTTSLQKLGSSLRLGADFRARATQRLAVVAHLDGVTGSVRESGSDVGLQGFRAAVHLELIY